jgi:hypothetical protein
MGMKSNVAVTLSKDSAVERGKKFAFSLVLNNSFPAGFSVKSAIIVNSGVIINCLI